MNLSGLRMFLFSSVSLIVGFQAPTAGSRAANNFSATFTLQLLPAVCQNTVELAQTIFAVLDARSAVSALHSIHIFLVWMWYVCLFILQMIL